MFINLIATRSIKMSKPVFLMLKEPEVIPFTCSLRATSAVNASITCHFIDSLVFPQQSQKLLWRRGRATVAISDMPLPPYSSAATSLSTMSLLAASSTERSILFSAPAIASIATCLRSSSRARFTLCFQFD